MRLVIPHPSKPEKTELPLTTIELPKEKSCKPFKNENSIIDTVDTGFGCDNTIIRDIPKPKFKIHLCKENYLGEFKSDTEKAKARFNLQVPSYLEVDLKIDLRLKEYTKPEIVNEIVDKKLLSYYNKEEVDEKLIKMTLNLDPIPIKNSKNGVTSGGVWLHIDNTVGEIHRYVKTI